MENNKINEMLEQINLIPLEVSEERARKAYASYLKHLEYMRIWRMKHKDTYNGNVNERVKRFYQNHPEHREKVKAQRKAAYYKNKYGMTEEEYKLKKQDEQDFLI